MNRFSPIAILFLFIAQCAWSQSVQFNTLSLGQGLSQATVTDIAQDQDGFMWIGTRDGLNRYDGYSFLTLRADIADSASISNNTITALEVAGDSSIWVGTGFGLSKLDVNTLKFRNYYHWFEDPLAISSNKIKCIAEDGAGRIWVGTDNGLNRLDDPTGNTFKRYSIGVDDTLSLSNNVVNDIHIDRKGRLWVATDGGLNLYDPDRDNFKRYRQQFEDANSLSNNNLLCITEDEDGILWIGTRNGLNKFNPDLEIFTRYFSDVPKAGLLSSNIIKSLLFDRSGDLWIGTPSGLNRFFSDVERSALYRSSTTDKDALPNDYITSLTMDRSGMIWIGSQSAGIATLDLEAPQFYTESFSDRADYEPEQNQIYDFLAIDSTTIWVATGSGVATYGLNDRKLDFLKSGDAPGQLVNLNTTVSCFATSTDSVRWIGTDGMGLFAHHLKGDSVVQYLADSENPLSISNNRIADILPVGDRFIWIATLGGGLNRLERESGAFKTWRFSGSQPNSLKDNNVQTLAQIKPGVIWLGTGNAGLYRLDIARDELKNYVSVPGKPNSLPSNSINQLFVDSKGQLWVSTSGGGMAAFNATTETFTNYDTKKGLANNVVLAITSDQQDRLWVSTNGGISAFNRATETFRNYGDADILGKNTFNARSTTILDDGTIFFGGSNGFDYFDVAGLRENEFIPPVLITAFQLMDEKESASSADFVIGDKKQLELDYNHSGFSLEFAALNFKQSQKNQYAYRVKGLFSKWRYIGTRRFATFSNLNPGSYTFEVIGSNNDGFWNNEPATLQISVRPAFWQTLWFQAAAVIILLGLFYLFYRYQLASEKARNQSLEQAVKNRTKEISKERDTNAILIKEVHHRVKNNLQIIVSLLNLQSRFIEDSTLLNVFGEIQNRVRSMSLIHEKMYQTKDLKTVNIEEYITDLAESLLRTYRLGHQVELDVKIEVNSFNSDTLTPLGLIINEVISNSLKYAFEEDRQGCIFVRLSHMDGKRYKLVIGDDGIGIPEEIDLDDTDSFGTELIGALTEQLNGKIMLLTNTKGVVYEVEFEDMEE